MTWFVHDKVAGLVAGPAFASGWNQAIRVATWVGRPIRGLRIGGAAPAVLVEFLAAPAPDDADSPLVG